MSGAVVAVAQWLVRATDDRVVTASNPVRLPHIACVFRRHNKPSVPSTYGVYDGGRKLCLYINIDFLNESFYEVLLSRILSVTNGCVAWYILCVVIKPLIYIDINPRISLVFVVKKMLNKFSFG